MTNKYFSNETYQKIFGLYQLSFVHFLLLSKLEGLNFWVGFTNIMCHVESFSQDKPVLFKQGMRIFFNMLKQMPQDFFYDNITKNNFLRNGMIHLMEILDGFENNKLHKIFDTLLKGKIDFFYTFIN